MKIFIRFGKNPNLSYAEIQAWLGLRKIESASVALSEQVGILNIPSFTDNSKIEEMMHSLGGSVKCGVVLAETTEGALKVDLKEVIKTELEKIEGKKFFGMSIVGQPPKDFKNTPSINGFALQIKKELNVSLRVVSSKEIELSSVIVKNEKLLRKGGDFNVITIGGQIFIGKTIAVQEFQEFGHRDYSRPEVDAKSGMLPPKLARIMINLAQQEISATVCDPFCGSGTLVSEMLVLGYRDIFASDLSEKAIADTKTNLTWIADKYKIDISNVKISVADATKLELPNQVGAIITEPYLGPALRGIESRTELLKIRGELEAMYAETLHSLAANVKKGGSIIIVVPALIINNEIFNLDLSEAIKESGLFLKTNFERIENTENRYPLLYQRPGQKVTREIFVLKKS